MSHFDPHTTVCTPGSLETGYIGVTLTVMQLKLLHHSSSSTEFVKSAPNYLLYVLMFYECALQNSDERDEVGLSVLPLM